MISSGPKLVSSGLKLYLDAGNTESYPGIGQSVNTTVCATCNENSSLSLTAPADTRFTSVDFASFGTPNGSCGSFTIGGCHAANSVSIVEGYLLDKNGTISIPANTSMGWGDPCGGTFKRLYVQATYTRLSTSWRNIVDLNHDCSVVGLPIYRQSNLGTITLNGTSQYITIPRNNDISPTTSLTQEIWVKLNSVAGTQVFFACQYGTSTNNSYCLWYASGALQAGINISGVFRQITGSSLTVGVWHHIVHTWNGATRSLYVNASRVASEAITGTILYDSGNTLVTVGIDYEGSGYNSGVSHYTNGSISQVRLYDRGLSEAEITQNYIVGKRRLTQ